MNTEIWQPVEGYEGLYEVSNLGRVKSLKYGKEKILKSWNNGKGYLFVSLCRNGKMKHFKVHRLVSTAFIPNPEGLPEINHIDENKSNNCLSNLEWCSHKYNSNYGTRTKRVASVQRNDPARSKAVEASRFSDFREICLKFPSANEAGRNGYDSSAVSYCCNGCYCSRRNFYKNLYWRFAS